MKYWSPVLCLAAVLIGFLPLIAEPAAAAPAKVGPAPASATVADAWKLNREGRYADAEKMAREILARTEANAGPRSVETAEVLDVLVDCLWRGGHAKEAETLELVNRAIDIKEGALGKDHPKVGASVMVLGTVLEKRGSFLQAREANERALAIYRKAYGDKDRRVADCHHNLASVFRKTHDLENAERHLRQAMAIYEAAEGPDGKSVADSVEGLANILAESGSIKEAIDLFRRSLRIREKSLGPQHPNVALSYMNLGYMLYTAGDYEEARANLEHALAIEDAIDNHGENWAMILLNLAIVETAFGPPAIGRWEQGIAAMDRVAGPDHPNAAIARANYAITLGGSDPGKALRLAENALSVMVKTFGPEHPRVVWMLDVLGSTALRMGDHEAASRYLEQALAVVEKKQNMPPDVVSEVLVELARCRAETNRTTEARALFEKALALNENVYGPEHAAVANVLEHIGTMQQRNGDLAAAKLALTRALAIREKVLGSQNATVAASLVALAGVEEDSGNLKEAVNLLQRAVGIHERWGEGDLSLSAAKAHEKLASCLVRTGDWRSALEQAARSEAISRPILRLTLAALPERQALSFTGQVSSGLPPAISAAMGKGPAAGETALDMLIRSRAIVLDEMARRHESAWAAHDPEVRALLEKYVLARQRLANLTLRGPEEQFPEKHRARLEKARADKEAAERELAAKSSEFRKKQVQAETGLAGVSASLPPGTALVSLSRYARLEPGSSSGARPHPPVDSYAAFVLRSGKSQPVLVGLGTAREIDAEVASLRKSLAEGASEAGSLQKSAEAAYRRAGTALRRHVWDPIEPYIVGATTVFIVPAGTLQLVSFAALPFGSSSYLVEKGLRIHYLSAERDLLPTGEATGIGLMAAGGPDFDAPALLTVMRPASAPRPVPLAQVSSPIYRGERSKCASFDSLRFSPLPAAGKEIDDIALAWREGTGTPVTGMHPVGHTGDPLLLAGPAANELAVKTNAPGKHILHLATHSYFLDACPRKPGVVSGEDQTAHVLSENPLLRSGLAFAGANRRAETLPDVDDGILTAEEIAALDLAGVEWAVLSGCDTGIGEIRTGEGVLGLRRAFQVAGARTVIMSLWPVGDMESRAWMQALYHNRLSHGMTTVEAVQSASLERLRGRRAKGQSTHPFYWAGFVAAGFWR